MKLKSIGKTIEKTLLIGAVTSVLIASSFATKKGYNYWKNQKAKVSHTLTLKEPFFLNNRPNALNKYYQKLADAIERHFNREYFEIYKSDIYERFDYDIQTVIRIDSKNTGSFQHLKNDILKLISYHRAYLELIIESNEFLDIEDMPLLEHFTLLKYGINANIPYSPLNNSLADSFNVTNPQKALSKWFEIKKVIKEGY